MSSENHQEIEVLRGRLAECQEQLSRVKEEDKEKERVINGWRILGKTARKKIDELERRSRGYDAWKGLANRRKDEMEAVQRRLTREANDREGERAQVEQIMRETIEQELREKMEQDLRTGIGDEHKANYVCRKRKRKATNGVQKTRQAPVQTLASTRVKRTFPSRYKR